MQCNQAAQWIFTTYSSPFWVSTGGAPLKCISMQPRSIQTEERAAAVQILNYSLCCDVLFTCHAVVLLSHPGGNQLRWWLTDSSDLYKAQVTTKINSHANLLLHQGVQRVAGQLCKFQHVSSRQNKAATTKNNNPNQALLLNSRLLWRNFPLFTSSRLCYEYYKNRLQGMILHRQAAKINEERFLPAVIFLICDLCRIF